MDFFYKAVQTFNTKTCRNFLAKKFCPLWKGKSFSMLIDVHAQETILLASVRRELQKKSVCFRGVTTLTPQWLWSSFSKVLLPSFNISKKYVRVYDIGNSYKNERFRT